MLTIVKAPPGFGKTTMAQSWAAALAAQGARVAWLSLTALDDDSERFFGALSAALRRAGNDGGADVDADDRDPQWRLRELSIPLRHRTDWLRADVAADPGEVFIVLDDYQEITRADIHAAIAEQLRLAPEQLHLIVLSRTEPPIERAELRAHDAVLELGEQTLRFTLAETQLLLRRSQAGSAAHDAAPLHAMTGGWIAALRAALLTARIHGDPDDYLRQLPATLRPINALFTELLERLPAEQLDFLHRVSVADRLCAPLAETLSGRSDAQSLLERLERQQLFVTALDEEPRWFAFHPLFRDCLLRHARQRDTLLEPRLRRRAAAWYAEHALWVEAIDQSLAAGDTAPALAWIEDHAMAAVGAGDLLTLLAWERRLRAHLVESPLRLRLAFAWALALAMNCDKALALLDGVEAEFAAQPRARAAVGAECLALRAVIVCTLGDYDGAGELAQQSRAAIGAATPRPWVASALRNVEAAMHLHGGRWRALYATPPAAGEGDVANADGDAPLADRTALAWRLSIRGLAEVRQGRLDDAAALLERGVAVGGSSRTLAALPVPTLAWVRYLQDRRADAAQLNAAHWDLNKRVGPIEGLTAGYLVAARCARLDGQPIVARQWLDEGASIGAARGWRRAELLLLLEKVRQCLLDGRAAEADACAHRVGVLAAAAAARKPLDRVDFQRAEQTARAWCALADGRAADAADRLAPLAADAQADGRVVDAIGLLGALALAHAATPPTANGIGAAAHDALAQALALVATSGAVRALVDQPVAIAPLLRRAAERDAAGDGVAPALTQALHASGAGAEATNDAGATALLERLSPRERHILQLLGVGRSNKEVARALGITPETVKTHVSRILGKLGAQNRAQAVAMVAAR